MHQVLHISGRMASADGVAEAPAVGPFGGARQPGSVLPVAILTEMHLDELSDEDLVFRHGEASDPNREAYVNELFRRNYTKVARWCLRFTDDRETAADLAQEIFTRVYQNLSSFQGNSKFSTWLFTISRNHCLNAIRSQARDAAEMRAETAEGFFEAIPDLNPDAQSQLERSDSARALRVLLAEALDETEQAVFTLHYGDELSLDGITRMLGLGNASGAKAYIVSARRKLARAVPRWKASGRSVG